MVAPAISTDFVTSKPSTPKNCTASSTSKTAIVTWSNVASIPTCPSGALVELHVVALGIAQERAPDQAARRFAVHHGVGARAFAAHDDRDVGGAHARQHLVEIIDPEREVVAPHLEQLGGLNLQA